MIPLKDGFGGPRDCLHAAPFEIGVAEWSVDEDVSRRQRADEFVKIEGNLGQSPHILREPGHIPGLAPAAFGSPNSRIASVIIGEGVEPATGNDDLDALIEDGGEDGIVSTQRMADGAELSALYERPRFEQVEPAQVVPDRLHRSALVAERIEIGLIIGEQRIGRRETDVTAPRQFDAVLVVRAVAEADDYFLSERMSLVQAKDARRFRLPV